MDRLMPFDELNKFKEGLSIHFEDGKIRSREDAEDIIDEMLDLFLLSYANGRLSARLDLGEATEEEYIYKPVSEEPEADSWQTRQEPSVNSVPFWELMETIDRKIAGKTWRDRVWEYFVEGGTEADIVRIAETETHRDYNEASYMAARKAGATKKVWNCLMLPTSRDSHIYLNGVTAPIDGEFYSINGGSTLFPGQWGIAEEDVNCLCYLTYQK